MEKQTKELTYKITLTEKKYFEILRQARKESRTQAISEFKEILKDKKYRYVRRSLIKRLEKTAQEIK